VRRCQASADGQRSRRQPGHRHGGQRGRAPKQACFGYAVSGRRAAGAAVDCREIAKRFARDRHFSTRVVLGGWDAARAGFVVREQAITVEEAPTPWRRVELALPTPTEAGEAAIRLWNNLPEEISAAQNAALNRTRWRVERSHSPAIDVMFQRLESVLHREICSRGHPRAVLLAGQSGEGVTR